MKWRSYIPLIAIALSFTLESLAQDELPYPVACYNFTRDDPGDDPFKNSSTKVPTGAGGLIPRLTPTQAAGAWTFRLGDDVCMGAESVDVFPAGGEGVQVATNTNYPNSLQKTYSLEVLFRFTGELSASNTRNYRSIINFKAANDPGLYVNPDGFLIVRSSGGSPTEYINSNPRKLEDGEWQHISITRTDGVGLIVYLYGEPEVTVPDFNWTINSNNYRFFQDATGGGRANEDGAGEVAYIRIYEEALDATSITQLGQSGVSQGDDIQITASATAFCEATEVTLVAAGGARQEYIWSTGDVTTTDTLRFVIDRDTMIWVQGVGISPCDRRCFDLADTIYLTVLPAVEPIFEVEGPVCRSQPVMARYTGDYVDVAPGGISWDLHGAASNITDFGDSIQFTYTAEGTFDVTMFIEHISSGCIRDSTLTVEVFPVANTIVNHPTEVCMFADARFEYAGNASATAVFTWDVGDGIIDPDQGDERDIYVHWETVGTKTVLLFIDEGGCISDTDFQIEVLLAPDININYPEDACEDEDVLVTFTGTASGAAVFTWSGDLPAGQPADPRNAVFNWEEAGTKNLTLTVAEGTCSVDSAFSILIKPVPTLSLTAPETICSDQVASIEYTGNASAAAVFDWGLDGGTIENETLAGRIFDIRWPEPATTPVTKTITLEIDDNGCISDTTFQIVIALKPTAVFTATPASICAGETIRVLYTGNADPSVAIFDWDFADASSATQVAGGQEAWDLEFDTSGDRTLGLTVTLAGCESDLFELDVEVRHRPIFNYTYDATICNNETLTITLDAGSELGDNPIFTFNNLEGTATQIGATSDFEIEFDSNEIGNVETFRLQIENDGCIAFQDFSINILFVPTTVVEHPATVCQFDDARFRYRGSADEEDPDISFIWDWDGGVETKVGAVERYDVVWDTPGLKTVRLTINTANCSVTDTYEITVLETAIAEFTGSVGLCQNQAGTYEFTGLAPAGTTFAWNFGADASTATATTLGPHNISWSTVGTKTVSLTTSLNGCDSTYSLEVVINAIPDAIFDYPNPLCEGQTGRFSWAGDPATEPNEINWNFPAGTTVDVLAGTDGKEIDVTFPVTATNQTYTVSGTMIRGVCVIPFSFDVDVFVVPDATFTGPGDCANEDIVLTITDYDAAATYNWTFDVDPDSFVDNGDGTVNVVWEEGGDYEITLTATNTNALGCADEFMLPISIGLIPSLDFTLADILCIDATEILALVDYNPAATYTLSFTKLVAGVPTADPPDTENFNAAIGEWEIGWASPNGGVKTGTLTVDLNGCTEQVSFQIGVYNYVDFELSTDVTCESVIITVTDNSIIEDNAEYVWDWDGGTATELADGTGWEVFWPTAGDKNIELTIQALPGFSLVCPVIPANATVRVLALPEYTASVTGFAGLDDIYICKDQDITINIENDDISLFSLEYVLLDADGGTINSNDLASEPGTLNIQWSEVGEKRVVIQINDLNQDGTGTGCPSSEVVITVLVFADPGFEVVDNNVCATEDVVFNFTGVINPLATNLQLDWEFEDEFGAARNPDVGTPPDENNLGDLEDPFVLRWNTPGYVLVRLTITTDDCPGQVEFHEVEVYIGTPPTFAPHVELPADGCEGTEFSFNYDWAGAHFNHESAASFIEWNWTDDAGVAQSHRFQTGVDGFDFITATAGDTEHLITWNTPGVKDVTLILNNEGCVAQETFQIEVFEYPVASFTLDNAPPFCSFETFTFTFDGTAPAGTTFQWNFGTNDPDSVNINPISDEVQEVQFLIPGEYVISLLLNNNGCEHEFPLLPELIILETPDISIDMDATACRFTEVPFDFTYLPFDTNSDEKEDLIISWDFDGASFNADSSAVIFDEVRTYAISLSAQNSFGCIATVLHDINILDSPPVTFDPPASICQYEEFIITADYDETAYPGTTFTSSSSALLNITGNQLRFRFGQGQSGMQSVVIGINAGGCVRDTTLQINVIPAPSMDIEAPAGACIGEVIQVRYTGDGDLINDDFTWNFSPGSNGGVNWTRTRITGQEGFNVIFNAQGTYTISLVASRPAGCATDTTFTIEVGPLPTFDVSYDDEICEGDTFTFTYNGPNDVIDLLAPTADNVVRAGNVFTIDWSVTGTQQLELILSNGGCERTQLYDLEIVPIPTGQINVSDACQGETIFVEYDGPSDLFADYVWTFEGQHTKSKIAGTESYNVVWTEPGTHTITLVLTENGCPNTFVETVTIGETPVADFNRPTQICENDLGTISVVNPNPAWIYNWDIGEDGEILADLSGGDSTQLQVRWTNPGVKTITMTVNNNGCLHERTRQVTVRNTPDAGFIMDDPFCLDPDTGTATGLVTYTGESDPAENTFIWDFDGGAFTQVNTSPIQYEVTYDAPGFRVVSLTVESQFCGSTTQSDTLAINNLALFELDDQTGSICAGVAIVLTFTGSFEASATLNWDFDGGVDTLLSNSPLTYEVVYIDPGEKTISLEIIGDECEGDDFNITFEVGERPTADFSFTPTDACSLDAVEFTYDPSPDFDLAEHLFNWDFGPGANVTHDATVDPFFWTVTWDSAGVKNVTLIVEDLLGCASIPNTQTLNIYNNDEISITASPLCVNEVSIVRLEVGFLEPGIGAPIWDFDNPLSSTQTDAAGYEWEVIWNTTGTKYITAQLVGTLCPDAFAEIFVSVGDRPDMQFTTDAAACVNAVAAFTYTGTDTDAEFLWEFDEAPSFVSDITQPAITASWATEGNKMVTVSVNNDGCVETAQFVIQINPGISADFDMEQNYCVGDQLNLAYDINNASANAVLTWTVDYNGTILTSNNLNFTVDLDEVGSFTVELEVDNQDGCTAFFEQSGEVAPTPVGGILAPQVACVDEPIIIEFVGEQIAGNTCTWTFDTPVYRINLGNQRYEVMYSEVSERTITLFVERDGCISEVYTEIIAVINTDGLETDTDEACANEPVTVTFDFGIDVNDAIDFTWNIGDATLISGDLNELDDLVLSWDSPGLREVSLSIAASNCISQNLVRTVDVLPTLVPAIDISIVNYACIAVDVVPTVNIQNGGDNPVINWFINDEDIGTTFDPTLLEDGDRIYADLRSDYRCLTDAVVRSNTVFARISNFAYPGTLIVEPNPVCVGDEAVISVPEGNFTVSYWETSADGSIWDDIEEYGVREITLAPTEDVFIRVLVVDEFGICRVFSPPALLRVEPYNPIEARGAGTIRAGDTRILEASRGSNFMWEPAQFVEGNPNTARISVRPPETTTFVVTGLTVDGCQDRDSVTVIVTPPLTIVNAFTPDGDGINDLWVIPEMEDYPQGEVYIYTRWGRRVFFSVGYNTPWDGRFNGDYLPSGVYFYVIDTKDGYPPYKGNVTLIR